MLIMAKNSEVEVSSKDEGFIDAWYGAILLENPTKSGRKKLQVRYNTLVDEDGSSLLIEHVEQRFIRPVPPYDTNITIEEGSVVDADLKDGWWTGVVVKKLEEDDKFLVYFGHPPDLIQFHRKQLRAHHDWIDSKWVKHENKELSKSLFSSGTMVEVSCKIDKLETVWVPALIVKEIDEDGDNKRFIVKCCDNNKKALSCNADEIKPNIIVDKCNVRPIPPPFFVEDYKLLDCVDAFRGPGWRQGLVRGVLSQKRYSVSFVATKEESIFKHSDLRPSKKWEDGVWHHGPMIKLGKETPFDHKRKMPVAPKTPLSEVCALLRPKKLKITRSCTSAKPTNHASLSASVTPRRTRKHTKETSNSAENTETALEDETNPRENVDATEVPSPHESVNQMGDDVMVNGDAMLVITPQAIPIVNSPPPETAVINETPVKETETETQGKTSPEKTVQPMRNQNGLGVDSNREKMPKERNSKENSHKRKRERKYISNLKESGSGEAFNGSEALITDNNICDDDYDDQPLSAWILGEKSSTGSHKSKLFSNQTSYAVNNSAADDETTRANEDTLSVLPFEKHSPVWKVFESMEVFKTVKQSPHFMPLLETREEFREGSAVGEMVKYSSLLERLNNVQLHTCKSALEGLKECFYELEKHGFDVETPISRIDMMLPLKDEQVNKVYELKDMKRKMTEKVTKKEKVEEDRREVEGKILQLRSQEAELKEKEEALENEIEEMQLSEEDLEKKIQDVEFKLQMLLGDISP